MLSHSWYIKIVQKKLMGEQIICGVRQWRSHVSKNIYSEYSNKVQSNYYVRQQVILVLKKNAHMLGITITISPNQLVVHIIFMYWKIWNRCTCKSFMALRELKIKYQVQICTYIVHKANPTTQSLKIFWLIGWEKRA